MLAKNYWEVELFLRNFKNIKKSSLSQAAFSMFRIQKNLINKGLEAIKCSTLKLYLKQAYELQRII
jgi:hypothetical protein